MTILGVIVEYNPFHNGHLYHLQQAKKQIDPEVTIAVMSGSFLQRGEAAIVDKWTRSKMALHQGVDLVVEIPTVYATQSANWFALGAISLLHQLGATDFVFGSETNQLHPLEEIAGILHNEPIEFQLIMEKTLSLGYSYPKALALSIKEYQKQNKHFDDFTTLQPNDILGLQYIIQNNNMINKMNAHTIKRKLVQYHDQTLHQHSFASATAIRKTIFESGELDSIKNVLPITSFELLQEQSSLYRIHQMNDFLLPLQLTILNQSIESLQAIHGMSEGLEYRLKDHVLSANHYFNLVELIKTKRYTTTRIQRLLLHILLQMTKEKIDELDLKKGPTYVRVLGFNQKGRNYLQKIKKQLSVPLITNIKKEKPAMLEMDILATHIYELGFSQAKEKKIEYKQSPIYLHI